MQDNFNELENEDELDFLNNEIEGSEESEMYDIGVEQPKVDFPFDPRLVKITVETSTIYGLAKRLQTDRIDLYPKFQRKSNLWDEQRQSRLIESLLLRFPIPAFYFDVENDNKWLVVDGLQRLSTLKNFLVTQSLELSRLEILKDLEGSVFKTLPSIFKSRILETNVTTFQIQEGTPKEVKYNLFQRINTGGLGLNNMEIRHALNQRGVANDFFIDLTENPKNFFAHFINENKLRTTRMEDRELALRFVAFLIFKYKDYEPTLTNFLDKVMEALDNKTKEEADELTKKLEKSIECYRKIFGNTRFGRGLTRRARFSSPLFEVWTSEIARLTDAERELLISQKEKVKKAYPDLLLNDIFHRSISVHTSSKTAVTNRFTNIHILISSILTS